MAGEPLYAGFSAPSYERGDISYPASETAAIMPSVEAVEVTRTRA